MLGAPIDKGFSRLAWLLPYLVGATGAVIGRLRGGALDAASEHAPPRPPAPIDAELDERIDDELRDLDSAEVRLKPDATSDRGLQPWQFFVLAALGCATAITFLARGQGLPSSSCGTVLMATAALVGLAALRASGRSCRRGRPHGDGRSAHARRRSSARKLLTLRTIKELEFDRAMGQAVRRRLAGDVGQAAGARGAPDAAARRRRRVTAIRLRRTSTKRLGDGAAGPHALQLVRWNARLSADMERGSVAGAISRLVLDRKRSGREVLQVDGQKL